MFTDFNLISIKAHIIIVLCIVTHLDCISRCGEAAVEAASARREPELCLVWRTEVRKEKEEEERSSAVMESRTPAL